MVIGLGKVEPMVCFGYLLILYHFLGASKELERTVYGTVEELKHRYAGIPRSFPHIYQWPCQVENYFVCICLDHTEWHSHRSTHLCTLAKLRGPNVVPGD